MTGASSTPRPGQSPHRPGWSQPQLAEALGMAEQQIQRDEANDYRSTSLARLCDIADALGVQVEPRGELRPRRRRRVVTMTEQPDGMSLHVVGTPPLPARVTVGSESAFSQTRGQTRGAPRDVHRAE